MRIKDSGHKYELAQYSSTPGVESHRVPDVLRFMKRIGDRYPGNSGSGYSGTNCQEVLRALMDRCKYLNNQIPCEETEQIITQLRLSLYCFEVRAAREHGLNLQLSFDELGKIEELPTCRVCGHILCEHK